MPPGPRYIPTDEWNAIVAAQMPQTPTVRPLQPDPSFLNSTQTWGIGTPAPMVNGQFVGASSPATWSPTGFLSGAPQGAYDAAPVLPQAAQPNPDLPQAPTPEEARRNQGPAPAGGWPEPMAGRVASAVGHEMALPDDTGSVIKNLKQYFQAMPADLTIRKPAPDLTNRGLNLLVSAEDQRAAALRNEAKNKSAEELALAGLETEAGEKRSEYATEDERVLRHRMGDYREEENNAAADRKWLREHPRVDPYQTFRTNAGAGIAAAIGAGLMATGASLRRDSTFEWTKQISNMLDREADMQIREIQNHRGNLNDSQANMKRILESSKDIDEAKMRFRNQQFEAINNKIRAVQHGTESKSVSERADALIAANREQIGKDIANAGMRREGLESQEAISRMMAAVQTRSGELNLAGIMAGLKATEREKLMQILATANRPKIEAAQKLKDLYGRAMTTGRAFFDALDHRDEYSEADLNTMSESFTGALKSYLEGTDRPGEANEIRAFGWTLDPTKLVGKFNRNDAKSVSRTMDTIRDIYEERSNFIWENTDLQAPIPPGGGFHKPAPPKAKK